MPRPSENYSKREQKQGRVFSTVFFCKDPEADEIFLNRLSSYWDRFYYILHDKDTYSEDDFDKYVSDNSGELPPWNIGDIKKPHYHVIAVSSTPCMLGRAAKRFAVTSNLVQRVEKFKESVQYLIHMNHPNKYQYSVEEVISNDPKVATIFQVKLEAEQKAELLFSAIQTTDILSMTSLASWAIKNHCWDELRRGQHIYSALLYEKLKNNIQKGE